MHAYFMPLALVSLTLGATSDLPNSRGRVNTTQSALGSAPDSQCHAVSGEIDQAGGGSGLSGTSSGDLEGTVVTVGGLVVVHGMVVFRPVEQAWTITGGTIDALIGQTLLLQNDFIGITAQFPLVWVNTTTRVVEGAQRGNLTYHGTTDLSALPAITSHLAYHGVICP